MHRNINLVLLYYFIRSLCFGEDIKCVQVLNVSILKVQCVVFSGI